MSVGKKSRFFLINCKEIPLWTGTTFVSDIIITDFQEMMDLLMRRTSVSGTYLISTHKTKVSEPTLDPLRRSRRLRVLLLDV